MNKRWAVVLVALPGCIRDAGECWVRGEDSGGVGGGVIVGAGAGGFGDVPPEPQNEPASADPCVQTAECEVTWKPQAAACQAADPGPGATCKTIYRGQHRSLQEAKAACERAMGVGTSSNVESCDPCYWVESTDRKKACVRMFDACQDKGPPCDKQVDSGKTLCAFCLDDCIGKREYKYSDCYQCGFE